MKTKEEILNKECNKYGGFVNVINHCGGTLVSQIWFRTMQEYLDQQTKELQEQLAENKNEYEKLDAINENYIEQISSLSKQLAAKENDSESQEDILHWVLHNYKPYEDGMSMVWRNINPDIDTLHTSKELHKIFKNRNK